jgi:phosphoenolpyruvate carboxykinase (GTP)
MGQRDGAQLPKLFWVNWFRKSDDGAFLWPGFGENSRVLKWVVERVEGTGAYADTPIGRVPAADAIDTEGLDLDPSALAELVTVDAERWRAELPQLEEHYATFGATLPGALREQFAALEKRLAG